MGASSHTFACATEAQKLEDWIGSMVRELAFHGGVPQLVINQSRDMAVRVQAKPCLRNSASKNRGSWPPVTEAGGRSQM